MGRAASRPVARGGPELFTQLGRRRGAPTGGPTRQGREQGHLRRARNMGQGPVRRPLEPRCACAWTGRSVHARSGLLEAPDLCVRPCSKSASDPDPDPHLFTTPNLPCLHVPPAVPHPQESAKAKAAAAAEAAERQRYSRAMAGYVAQRARQGLEDYRRKREELKDRAVRVKGAGGPEHGHGQGPDSGQRPGGAGRVAAVGAASAAHAEAAAAPLAAGSDAEAEVGGAPGDGGRGAVEDLQEC